ncbi:MAG: polyamine aminopropyltransferase [bacterium]|nr:polyamine aminopropyltransferase [bacterium]
MALIDHHFLGKMLLLDGAVQITMRDEFIYREMMTHVPLFAHGAVEQVLIIGGGDCSIAGEVLKHRSVQQVTQVEIDASVIEFARTYFPELTKPVFADARFQSVVGDGMRYVARTNRRFDVIIVDSTDPQGPGEVLFSKRFYAACKRCLTEHGILVTQNGVPFLQSKELFGSLRHFRKLFLHHGCYLAAVPTYVGGHMAMGWASSQDIATVALDLIRERYAAAGSFQTKYWTPRVHAASFALPRFIEEIAERA